MITTYLEAARLARAFLRLAFLDAALAFVVLELVALVVLSLGYVAELSLG
ncbi:MAG TPA: hypothetical protein PKB03_07600 [Baekduia sp.]|nr:hypothetical protein [Baekduia sp.]